MSGFRFGDADVGGQRRQHAHDRKFARADAECANRHGENRQ